jgi:uncharacterized protein YhaN
MRFERVRAHAFGRFEDFDSGSVTLADFNVVVGPNEAGKTTFFHLLYSVLFGLYPASKEHHPYTPWSGRDLEVEADMRLDDGEEWAVHRKLTGSPTARLTRSDRVENLRNQTLPSASHVTREVFRQIFALTLAEVGTLESRAWSEIQDRLIGGMGARDLVPARSVADALEEEARRLWRPDRRGNQEIRVLQKRIQGATAARRAALDADRLLRVSVRELERAQEEREAVRVETEKHGLVIERITKLLPLRVRMDQAARLDQDAGPPGALDGLPSDPSVERGRLLDEVADLGIRLCATKTRAQKAREQIEAFSSGHQTLLEVGQDVHEVGASMAAAEPVKARLAALEQEIQGVERRIGSTTHQVFERPLTAEEESLLRSLAVRDLHDRVRDAGAARDRRREDSMRAAAGGTLPEASLNTLMLGLLASVVAAVLLFWPSAAPTARVIGGVAALSASTLLARWGTLRQAASNRTAAHGASGPDPSLTLHGPYDAPAAALRDFFSGLPVRSESLTDPGPELVTALMRLQELWEEREARTRERTEAIRTLDAADRRLADLGQRLELQLPQPSAASMHVLHTKLREAEHAEENSKAARAELDRVALEESAIVTELSARTETLDRLEQALRGLGSGDVEAGIGTANRMRRAGETAAEIRADLERTHGGLGDLMERLEQIDDADEGGSQEWDDVLARARAAEKECSERIAALSEKITELKHTRDQEAARTTADEIDGEVDALESEVRRLKHEHDRKIVLAHAIRVADGRFREEHQPDIVRRASEYFASITDGRYDGIIIGDAGELDVRRGEDGRLLAGSTLSSGTKEQLYLAMRLAAMDHLDHDRERLPVFIDETLVNWDAGRRARGVQLLRELSQRRQVFLLTCHESWAVEMIDQGANRITLR